MILGPRRAATRLLWSWALGRSTGSDASGTVTRLQGQFNGDRLIDKAKLLQHFGFASRPPANTDLVAICPSGEPTSALVIATNSQEFRPPPLEEGDSSQHDKRGAYLLFKEGGPVVDAGGGTITVQNATSITIEGAKTVTVNGAETLNVTASRAINLDTPTVIVTGDVVSDGTVLT